MQTHPQILQVEGIGFAGFLSAFSDLLDSKIKSALEANHPPAADSYITRQEVADYFKITLPTVHAWIKADVLKAYKIGNKTRFLFSEVKAAPLTRLQTSKAGSHA